jgi:hypothetical protein
VNDRWRTITIILAVILALLGGITAAVVITGGPSPAVLPSPTTAAGASGQPSAGASAVASAGAPSVGPSAAGSVAPSSPTPVPSATPQPNLTTIVFTAMKLDAQSGTLAGTARTFAFTSEGAGKVVVGFKGTASGGKAVDCLKPAGGSGICRTGTVETLTFTTSAAKTNWIVTAIGSASAAPTLDISLTFSSLHRSVKLTNGRFDGQAYPYDGATFKLTTPTAGSLTVKANWGGHPFDYSLILEPASTPPHTLGITGNSNGATATFPVTAATAYKGTLANLDDGFGVTPLTMTVSWP